MLCVALLNSISFSSIAQDEPFERIILNRKPANPDKYRLAHPFEIVYGPDNHLYIATPGFQGLNTMVAQRLHLQTKLC